jgi:RimJ/RimL family protein N-acetyltransferase
MVVRVVWRMITRRIGVCSGVVHGVTLRREIQPGGREAGPLSPELRTERLLLRPPRADDRSWLHHLQTDAAARAFLGGARRGQAAEDAVDQQLSAAGTVFIAERDDGQPVGVLDLDDSRGDMEVSYVFDPTAWGQGFAVEALTALLAWATRVRGPTSVIAVTQAANTHPFAC